MIVVVAVVVVVVIYVAFEAWCEVAVRRRCAVKGIDERVGCVSLFVV